MKIGRAATQRDLSADIHFLGDLLGGTIRRLAGEEAFALVEQVRAAAKALRARNSVEEARKLRDHLGTLDLQALRTLIRSFSLYFDLVNLAEQPRPLESLASNAHWQAHCESFGRPRSGILSVAGARRQCATNPRPLGARPDRSCFHRPPERIAAAHPPRKSWPRSAGNSTSWNTPRLAARERETALAEIAEEIETSLVRPIWSAAKRPSVLDEVAQGLGVVGDTLLEVVPRLYRQTETALRRVYPDLASSPVPSFLRFGGWIGGDRDGNPAVTHDVTAEAVRLQQETILRRYLACVDELGRRLSHSAGSGASWPPDAENVQDQARTLSISLSRRRGPAAANAGLCPDDPPAVDRGKRPASRDGVYGAPRVARGPGGPLR